MSLKHKWSAKQIKSVITPALNGSEAKLEFDHKSQAESFRFACYDLRKRKRFSKDPNDLELSEKLYGLSFILLLNESKPCILIKKTPMFEFKQTNLD
jgi:hypothetical protein